MHVLYSKIIIKAGCAIVTVWEALLIGIIGGFLANITDPLLVWLRVDDAVGATCVHGFGGAWGMIAVGIFAKKETYVSYTEYDGVLHGKTFLLIILLNPLKQYFAVFSIYIFYKIYIFIVGGGLYLLGVQAFTVVLLTLWAMMITFILLYVSTILLAICWGMSYWGSGLTLKI